MNKILEFFYKYLTVIIFVILEVLAFGLVVNKNDLQRSVAFRYATTLSAWTYGVANSVADYFGLGEINKQLAEENARLHREIADYRLQIAGGGLQVADSVKTQSAENYLSAKVVFNSVYDLQNYIIIDKGSAQGIEEDMGVFAPQGVVGVVQCVSKNYAVVLPIINPEQVISAKIKGDIMADIVQLFHSAAGLDAKADVLANYIVTYRKKARPGSLNISNCLFIKQNKVYKFIFRIFKGIHNDILLVCFCHNHKKHL